MPRYYSQHGEDSILWQLFGAERRDGVFVEVGALDGLRFSNTFSFEEAGWTGLCVEAHADYIELLVKNRPRSVCIHAAASDHDADEATFYANARGSLSTLEPSLEGHFREHFQPYFHGFEHQTVRLATLDTLLAEAGIPEGFDFLSIDVEGHEESVLAGFDLARYRPRVVVLEEMTPEHGFRTGGHMRLAGYHCAGRLACNLFYCRDAADVSVLQQATVAPERVDVPHPLDENLLPPPAAGA